MPGHLFVTRGSVTSLACDAILVPSGLRDGRFGDVTAQWSDLGLPRDAGGFVAPAPDEERRVVELVPGSGIAAPAVWVAHTGDAGRGADWYAAAVRAFVAGAGARRTGVGAVRPLDDRRPLLAVPLVGTGQGGMRGRKGEVVLAIVNAVLAELERTDVDVALVLFTEQAYAAAQQARARLMEHAWRALDAAQIALASELADQARRDRLVLFMGAGTGAGAGLPGWKTLLGRLGRQAGLSDEQQSELLGLDPRDAGAILERRFRRQRLSLAAAIVGLVAAPRVSLVHQLLASLPVTEAATTNYDQLFERAWRDAGRRHAVLPKQSASDARRWLLKLHGSVDHQERIVLSREDYLLFEGHSGALAGLVQAMLLTRHMLFVGYSLSDDNFHRLVHQARAVRGAADERPGGEFGTALSRESPQLSNELWQGDVRFVNLVASDDSSGARRLAILLDRIGLEASPAAVHVRDHAYRALFTDAELAVRDRLDELERAAGNQDVQPAMRRAIQDALDGLRGH